MVKHGSSHAETDSEQDDPSIRLEEDYLDVDGIPR